jgi:hypothetical protein
MAKMATELQMQKNSHLVQPAKDEQQDHQVKPVNPASESARVLQLQRTHGNQYVQKMVESGTIQREVIPENLYIGGDLIVDGKIKEGSEGKPAPPPPIDAEPTW